MTPSVPRWMILCLAVLNIRLINAQGIWTKYGCRVDLCFIIDNSLSVGADNWKVVQSFVENFVNQLTISQKATQVGLVTFAAFGELVFAMDDYNGDKNGMIEAIRSAKCCALGTKIDAALYKAKETCFKYGSRKDAPDVAILITDGESNYYEANKEARSLRESGVSIVALGVGNKINKNLLSAIADDDDSVFLPADFNSLLNDTSLILGRSCSATESCSGGELGSWSESDSPLLLDCPRLSNPIVDGNIFKFECYINYSVPIAKNADARFLVQFLHDGKPNEEYTAVLLAPETTATLHEYYLMGHMGQYLSCQVQTFWQSSTDVKSPAIVSRSYWTGITVSNEVITIFESDNNEKTENDNVAQVFVYSSLPVLCSDDNTRSCDLSLSITSEGSVAVYQRHRRKIRRCVYKLFEEDWKANESWAYNKKSPLQIAAMIKVVPVKIRHATIRMNTRPSTKLLSRALGQIQAGTEYSPWNTYTLPMIQVQIVGGKKRGKCSSTGDPHITTFDGLRINVYERGSSGSYYLFKSNQYNLQVQTYIEDLYNKQVAVNDGGSITIITLSKVMRCSKNIRTKVTSDGSNNIFVHTYSGVQIKVTRNGKLLQIFIEVPSQFWKKTAGLCSSYDGDQTNDSDGLNLNDFIKNNKITNSDESYFHCPESNYIPYEFCQCSNNSDRTDRPISDTTVCGLEDRSLDHSTPSYPVTLLLPRFVLTNNKQRPRTKRGADEQFYTDDIVDYEPPVVSGDYKPYPGPPAWGTHGITEAEARKLCSEALTNSSSFSVCKQKVKDDEVENIIQNCMMDIQITGDMSFAFGTTSVYQDVCRVNLINDAADYVTNPEDPLSDSRFKALFTSFLDTSCPRNCNGNGICKEAVCKCNSGYDGVDCSVIKGTPPSNVQYLQEQFCDKAERPCRSIRLQADNITATDHVRCKMMITFFNSSISIVTTEGKIQAPGQVSCRLPTTLPTFFTFNVAISNDGKRFTKPIHPFQELNVGNSAQMWPECLKQTKYRSKTVTHVIENRCYITEVNKKNENRGITTTLHDLLINEFASVEDQITNINVDLLNKYTAHKPYELCEAVGSRSQDNGNIIQNVFHSDDIKIADGYPEMSYHGGSRVKWLVEVPADAINSICIVKEREGNKLDVGGAFLKKAMAGLGDEVSKLISKEVTVDYEVAEVKVETPKEPKRSTAASFNIIPLSFTSFLTTFLIKADGFII